MDAFVLRYPSDTAHPQDVVPIYHIHSLEHPFCALPSCWCHQDQAKVAELLMHIKSRAMAVREAADFADGSTV